MFLLPPWTRAPLLGFRQPAVILAVLGATAILACASSWTFGYLTALAGLVGLVAVAGLLLYLESRQRSRVASYAMGRRMGLSRAVHLRSLLAELGMLLVAAAAVGGVLAWTAVLLVYRSLDVDTARPPPPLLTAPTAAIGGGAVAAVAVTMLAALYAQRSADRTDAAEVLRLGS